MPCPQPRVAVIAGAYNDEEEARRRLTTLRDRDLPFGYPVVAHPGAFWLDLPRSRIAIVVALFRSRRDAAAWQRRHPGFTQRRIGPTADGELPYPSSEVIRLASSHPVPAYGLREAIRLSEARLEGKRAPPAAPRCEVAGDALFVFSEQQYANALYGKNNRRVDTADDVPLLPVRCGAKVRYVDPRATDHETVFWMDRGGTRHLTQITEAGCAFTTFESLVVDAVGRRILEHHTTIEHDGC